MEVYIKPILRERVVDGLKTFAIDMDGNYLKKEESYDGETYWTAIYKKEVIEYLNEFKILKETGKTLREIREIIFNKTGYRPYYVGEKFETLLF